MFIDPLQTLSLTLPAGWALEPFSCALERLVFLDWRDPRRRQIHVHLRPSDASALEGDGTWEARVRAGLPPDVQRCERRDGPVLWVERPGREGRPDQRWAIVRGLRLDASIEQVGVPVGGALATPELLEAVRTLDIGINHHLGERQPHKSFTAHLDAAYAAHPAEDGNAAVDELLAALAVARSTWLYSLVGAPLPEVSAAMGVGEVLLRLGMISGESRSLHDASRVLLRCRLSLKQMPVPRAQALLQKVAALLGECRSYLAQLAGEPIAGNDLSELLMRSRVALRESIAHLKAHPRGPESSATQAAVEDAMSAAALAALGVIRALPAAEAAAMTARVIRDTADQLAAANIQLQVEALRLLVAAGTLHSTGKLLANSALERTRCANALAAARELARIAPDAHHELGLVLALNLLGAALMGLGDEASLTEAQVLLDEAEQRLQDGAGPLELRAQLALNQAWLHFHQRHAPSGLADADRALAAAEAAGADRLVRAARSLRAIYLSLNGRSDEAAAEARAALAATHDDAASTHHLNLAAVLRDAGDIAGATAALRDGLAAALADQPLAPEVVRLLFVAATCLDESDPAGARAATQVAETVLDALRTNLHEAVDMIGFDDAAHHRQLAGSLVQRHLDAGDVTAALASADRHRARALLQQLAGDRPGAGRAARRSRISGAQPQGPLPEVADAGAGKGADSGTTASAGAPADVSLGELIAQVDAAARQALAAVGQPVARDGAALADLVAGHGRMALVCHPSGDDLLLLLVLPSESSVAIRHGPAALPLPDLLALTERLRAQLGIVVAARAARGLAPPQAVEDLDAALIDSDKLADADAELNNLLADLHQALLAPILPYLRPGMPLVVLPYRELGIVPLCLLRDVGGQPLSERHPLSVLPSLATLAALAPAAGRVKRAVVVGDPRLDPQQGLSPLPGAADEARAVAKSLRAAGFSTKLLLHDKATESAFRAAATGACIVHLACHAVLRPQASESPLFLAPQPPDDGLLLPSEIGDLQLNGALVVLAACQSGLGRATADGVVGLGRAFLQAGARCVLLSLWRVSDAATQQLMTQFYAHLVGAPDAPALDAAAALAAAQRSSRADSGDVAALWGPWLLVGDGGWRLPS